MKKKILKYFFFLVNVVFGKLVMISTSCNKNKFQD